MKFLAVVTPQPAIYHTGKLRYINIRYVFVKDKVDKGEVELIIFSNTSDVFRVNKKTTTQGKGFKNIQGLHNGLQTNIIIGINPSFNQRAC